RWENNGVGAEKWQEPFRTPLALAEVALARASRRSGRTHLKVCVMTDSSDNSYSDEELAAEFDRLFPQGFAGPDVLQELAPAGWDNSPLLVVFHPTAEQIYEESRRLHANLEAFRKPDESRPLPPAPTLEEVSRDHRNAPLEPER